METNNKKKITKGYVWLWILNLLFLAIGIVIIKSSPMFGPIIISCAVAMMVVLILNKFALGKLHPIIFGSIKLLLLVLIFVSIGAEAVNGAERMFPQNPVAAVGHYLKSVFVNEGDKTDGNFKELPMPPRQLGGFSQKCRQQRRNNGLS